MNQETILEVTDLKVHFPAGRPSLFARKRTLHAVNGVSFTVPRRSSFGLVGESGSGKSTTAQAVMRLLPITAGRIRLGDTDLTSLRGRDLRSARRRFQMIFQDPFSTLNPRQRAGAIIREPLDLFQVGTPESRRTRCEYLLEAVGLPQEAAGLFPHQFSGGQRQRLMIARVLSTSPEIMVCDEPVSALDVAIQAQILNLLKSLQQKMGLSSIFISHDLGVVQYICDQVGVMYLGQLVESASVKKLFVSPRHPYTWALIAAALSPGPLRSALKQRFSMAGEPPNPIEPPSGCRLAARCPFAEQACRKEAPDFTDHGDRHFAACRLADEIMAEGTAIVEAVEGPDRQVIPHLGTVAA